MKRSVIVGVLLAIAVLAGSAWLLLRPGEPALVASPPAPPGSVPALPPAARPAAAPSAANAAPWLTPQPGTAAGAPAAGGEAARIDALQQRLQAMSAGGRQPSIRELDAVLVEMQRSPGSNLGGVNLQALRDNLARADRMQQIAKELQGLAESKVPQQQAQIQLRLAELQTLQAGMQPVTVGVPAPPGKAAP